MAKLKSLYFSLVVCLLLVSLLFPTAHVQLGLVPEHEKFAKMRNAKVSEEVTKHLSAQGLGKAGVERLQKCALLCGKSVEARLQSQIMWMLNFKQSQAQVAEAIATCSPSMGDEVVPILKQTVRWLSDIGLTQDELAKALTTCPSVFVITAKQNLKPTVQWLLDLELRQPQVVKVIISSPQVLGFSVEDKSKAVCFLLDLGLSKNQSANVIARSPDILARTTELKGTVQWLLDFGLTQRQVAGLITASPLNIVDQKIKPQVQWFLDQGMTKKQVKKAITTFPRMLRIDTDNSLKPKVQFLKELGLTQAQVARVIAAFPQVLGYSIEQNLKPKVQWLLEFGFTKKQVAKVIAACPQILGYSIEGNLKPMVQLSKEEVAKTIPYIPPTCSILHCDSKTSLKPKVEWLMELGLTNEDVVKVIAFFPAVLSLSINKNLGPKRVLLKDILGEGVAEAVLKQPSIFGYSYQRLSTRLKILVARNETEKIASAMLMTEDRFLARFVNKQRCAV